MAIKMGSKWRQNGDKMAKKKNAIKMGSKWRLMEQNGDKNDDKIAIKWRKNGEKMAANGKKWR